MANETTKQIMRRSTDRRFATRWIVGNGIDIGCGADPLSALRDFFPLMQDLRPWDMADGDAALMASVADQTYDFVHSSHCLEHLSDPALALQHWIRICKDQGHLVITVPDEDLYEQGIWPSTFNDDHKWTFTVFKPASWSPRSVNLTRLLEQFGDQVEILKIEKLDSGFNYHLPRQDQTLGGLSESGIEFVLKKKPASTTAAHPLLPNADACHGAAQQAEDRGETATALALCARAIELQPDHVAAHVLAGRMHFKQGDYRAGAEQIAWIWHGRLPHAQLGLFASADGTLRRQDHQRIVLSADSGLGDTLQFVRYAAVLAGLGAEVTVECQPELCRLVAGMAGVAKVVRLGELQQSFDARVPLHNLIGACHTTLATIPHAVPYLSAPVTELARFAGRLQALDGLRIGLCWAGNPGLPRDQARSIPQSLLAPLLAVDQVHFISLQKGQPSQYPQVLDWTAELQDMATTAGLVAQLDLVITIDSAVAHLAGALGRPVWLLNRFDSCWRWMEQRNDSPWYPTLVQFRQASAGAWPAVIEAVTEALVRRVQAPAAAGQTPG